MNADCRLFFVSNAVNAYMYAPKRIFFFDFDKKSPRLATRWGGCSLSQALCKYAMMVQR